jgi:hypothetical protein
MAEERGKEGYGGGLVWIAEIDIVGGSFLMSLIWSKVLLVFLFVSGL